ncbi:MAG: Ig-like domain-containing protein [Thermodesulfovibrionales bacterium]
MKKPAVLLFFALLLSAFLTGCGCGGGDNPPSPPVLMSLEVSPVDPSIALGTAQQFKATGVFSDNTTQDMTESVTWSLSDEAIASISNEAATKGLAHSLSAGTTKVTATSGSVSGSTSLTVTAATLVSIEVTPANPTSAVGGSQPFKATGTFTDDSTQDMTSLVTWSSSDQAVATIGNNAASKGLAQALSAGTTSITATFGDIFGSTSFTVTGASLVSLDVTPKNPTVVKGMTQQFKATGTFSDNSTQDLTSVVSWSSSAPAIASISNAAGSRGLATSLSAGTTPITATFGNITGQTAMTVTAVTLVSIKVTPVNPMVHFGATVQFTATGLYSDGSSADITTVVTWSSADTSIATISNAPGTKGLATADHKQGSTIITATLGTISGSTMLVDP